MKLPVTAVVMVDVPDELLFNATVVGEADTLKPPVTAAVTVREMVVV